MSSKFLSGGDSTDLAALSDGSFALNVVSAKIQDLTPGSVLRANADKELISTQIEESDLAFTVLANPNTSNLISDGLEVTAGNVLKTDTIESTSGGPSGITITSPAFFTNGSITVPTAGVICERVVTGKLFGDTGTVGVYDDLDLNPQLLGKKNITNALDVSSETLQVTGTSTLGAINGSGIISGYVGVETDRIYTDKLFSVDGIQNLNVYNTLNMNASALGKKSIINASQVSADTVTCTTLNSVGTTIFVQDNLEMKSKDILGVGDLTTSTISGFTAQGDINLNANNITNGSDIQTGSLSATQGSISVFDNMVLNNNDIVGVNSIAVGTLANVGGSIAVLDNIDFQNNAMFNLRTITGNGVDAVQILNAGQGLEALCDRVRLQSVNNLELSAGASSISCESTLDLNENSITNVGGLTLANGGVNTVYVLKATDFGTPGATHYLLADNTTYIICGQITLLYGIEFGANCSLRGIDYSASLVFDESARDCSLLAIDNNMYISQLTIINGGGRFSLSGRGLIDAQNYNTGAPAPFYGRNKRFKISDVNIIRPYRVGTVEGFGTLNFTNNFVNGGGGLAGQAATYYTNEGLSVSDGLSLEFNNNKMVLFAGAQQVSTAKLLNMKARVSDLLGFNAVTVTGNIFHPRSTEVGINFDADSRTKLGNISGNVFIRDLGSGPLINYTDQSLYDNYNPLAIENYSINANAGVVNSEPNLKSAVGTSASTTATNPGSRSEAVPSDNAQVLQIDSSARFGVQLDLTGVTVAFVVNERITDTASGNTALILSVDTAVGALQSVYITDMSGTFSAAPTTFTSGTGNATGGALLFKYKYLEKDPRKLVTVATFVLSTGNNEQYFVAPGNGTADVACEVSGVSNNAGVGGTVSLSCTRLFANGDIINFFLSSSGGSATSIVKGIINVK